MKPKGCAMSSDLSSGNKTRQRTASVWPHLVIREAAIGFLVLAILVFVSLLSPLGLLPPADSSSTEIAAKAPWFFVGMQEMLYHLSPEFASAAIPALAVLFLFAFPYLSWKTILLRELGSGKWIVLAVGLFLTVSFVIFARIPFYSQAVLTLLFVLFGAVACWKKQSPVGRISLTEFIFAYLFVSYAVWTIIGQCFRTSDWHLVF